ncbi:MAG TPA: DUF6364 family protein [Parafilimonas sp.]|nr:DUF6364 family protein [Parafilimonas sp.]
MRIFAAMKTRLNLTIEEDLLKKVKAYADRHNESISNLVEEYFETIVKKPKRKNILDVLKELPKPKDNHPADYDFVKGYYEENAKKYGF